MKLVAPVDRPHPLRKVITDAIYWADSHSERSLQEAIGPSEIGNPCMRRLAYRLNGVSEVNTTSDPWFAIVGTAVHDWLAFAFEQYQRRVLGRGPDNPRWLIERRVHVHHDSYETFGNTDVYDCDLEEVVDWKIVGADTLKRHRDQGPSQLYKVQAHTYGKGWKQRGRPVRAVTIVSLPRSNFLKNLHIWSEPFDESVADAALSRLAAIDQLRRTIPAHLLPTEENCAWCPFYRPHKPADEHGCPGPEEGK